MLSDHRLMTYAALTRVGTISPIVAFLNRIGVSADRLLATAQLPAWVTAEREGLIPQCADAWRRTEVGRPLQYDDHFESAAVPPSTGGPGGALHDR